MKIKKPYWEKRGEPISGKIKSESFSFATDQEIRSLMSQTPQTPTQIIEGFISGDIGIGIKELQKEVKKFIYSRMKTKRGGWSKALRIYLEKNIRRDTKKPEIKERMKNKIKEENNES